MLKWEKPSGVICFTNDNPANVVAAKNHGWKLLADNDDDCKEVEMIKEAKKEVAKKRGRPKK